jgi:hypothetical protein
MGDGMLDLPDGRAGPGMDVPLIFPRIKGALGRSDGPDEYPFRVTWAAVRTRDTGGRTSARSSRDASREGSIVGSLTPSSIRAFSTLAAVRSISLPGRHRQDGPPERIASAEWLAPSRSGAIPAVSRGGSPTGESAGSDPGYSANAFAGIRQRVRTLTAPVAPST